jgi:hypothetical protein
MAVVEARFRVQLLFARIMECDRLDVEVDSNDCGVAGVSLVGCKTPAYYALGGTEEKALEALFDKMSLSPKVDQDCVDKIRLISSMRGYLIGS